MQSVKGQNRSGSVRARAERMACLRVLKPEWIFDFSSRGCAKIEKLGTQSRRYPANP